MSAVFRLSAVAAAGLAATISSALADSPTLTKIKEAGAITLGYREASIPFSYLDADQKPIGFSLDLCSAIVERVKADLKLDKLGVKLVPVNSSNRIPLIQNGTIDMECGGTSSSSARLQQVSFTVATFVSQPRWLTKTASGLKSAYELKGKTVVVTQGSNAVGIVQALDRKENLNLQIVQAKDHAQSLLMLDTGRAAAFLEDDILLAGLKANAPNPDAFTLLPDAYDKTYYGLLLPKGDEEFKSLADGVLKQEMASGAFTKLYEKWFVAPIPPDHHALNFALGDGLKERIAHPSDQIDN